MTPENLDELQSETQYYDMTKNPKQVHQHDRIVGNRLMCSLHSDGGCPEMVIKPTQVLERNAAGELELIDKMP